MTVGAAASAAILQVIGLTKAFGGLLAIDNLTLDIRSGETLGIVGPNGAGKTAFINVVTGFYPATRGEIWFRGQDLTGLPRHRISRLGVARTFQNIRLFKRMTVLENVLVADKRHAAAPLASLWAFSPARRDIEHALSLLDVMGLADGADRLAGTLAYGDARRLEIARALAGAPKLLFLDEPAAGMNEAETDELIEDVRKCRGLVEATVLVEHDMTLIRELSDRLIAFDFGRKMAEGTTEEVFNNRLFMKAYLGIEAADA